MKPKSSIFYLILIILSNNIFSQDTINKTVVTEPALIIEKLNLSVKTLLDGRKDFTLNTNEVKVQGEGYSVSGQATFFGIAGVSYEANMASATEVSQFKATFLPNSDLDRKDQKNLTREVMDKWMPETLKDLLKINTFTFLFENNTVKQVNISMSSAPWKILGENSFAFNDVVVQYTVINPIDKKTRNMKAEIFCKGSLGGSPFSMNASVISDKTDWVLSTKISKFSVNNLFSELNIERPNPIPAAFWNYEINECNINFLPFTRALNFTANSSIGIVEFNLSSKNRKNNGHDFLLGFSPPQNFTYSNLDPSLSILDQLNFKNTALILSSDEQESNLPIFNALGQKPRVTRGLTLMAMYDLHTVSPELEKFMGVSNVLLVTTITDKISELKLQAKLQTNINFDDKGAVVLKEIVFTVAPYPSNFTISMSGIIDAKINKDILRFKSTVGVNLTELSLNIQGMMIGTWNNPFQIANNVQLSDLGLGLGLSFRTTPIPLPSISFAGKLKVGDPANPKFGGDVAVAVDLANPMNCMIDAGFNKIVIKDIVSACAPNLVVPQEIQNTILTATLENARLTVVPSPVGITLFDKAYEPGFLIAGEGSIADFKAKLKFSVSQAGIEAKAGISPINLTPFFSLTGSQNNPDPMIDIVIKTPELSGIKINGKVSLLGLSRDTDIKISDSGFDIKIDGKIFNLFESSFQVAGKNMNSGGDYYVKAEMKNDLFDYITQYASAEIDKATKQTQNDITAAQATLTREQTKIDGLYSEVNNMKNTVQQERDRDCGRLRSAESAVEAERQKVQSIQSNIDAQNREIAYRNQLIADRKKYIDDGDIIEEVTRGTEAIPYFAEQAWYISAAGTQLAAFVSAKAIADAALTAARETVGGLGYLCEQTPIEADPRVATLIGSIQVSKGVIEGAKQVMEGGKIIGVGTLDAAKWIVKNGPMKVVNITFARFEGALSSANGGKISLEIKGTFGDKPLDTKFNFDFNDTKSTVESWARTLLGI